MCRHLRRRLLNAGTGRLFGVLWGFAVLAVLAVAFALAAAVAVLVCPVIALSSLKLLI